MNSSTVILANNWWGGGGGGGGGGHEIRKWTSSFDENLFINFFAIPTHINVYFSEYFTFSLPWKELKKFIQTCSNSYASAPLLFDDNFFFIGRTHLASSPGKTTWNRRSNSGRKKKSRWKWRGNSSRNQENWGWWDDAYRPFDGTVRDNGRTSDGC